jgi:hypothetical protein
MGVTLSGVIGADPWSVLACVLPLSAVSLYANYRSSCLVVMRTLNVQRAEIVLRALLRPQQWPLAAPAAPAASPLPLSPALTAEQVCNFPISPSCGLATCWFTFPWAG